MRLTTLGLGMALAMATSTAVPATAGPAVPVARAATVARTSAGFLNCAASHGPGVYEGPLVLRIEGSGHGVTFAMAARGIIKITVADDMGIVDAAGSFTYGMEGVAGSESSLDASGEGTLEFRDGRHNGVEVAAVFPAGGGMVAMAGVGTSTGATGGASVGAQLALKSGSCLEIGGTVSGDLLLMGQRALAAGGLTASVTEATWTASRVAADGEDDPRAAIEEVRTRASAIAERARKELGPERKGRRTVGPLREFRALLGEIRDGQLGPASTRSCLLDAFYEAYDPIAALYQRQDVKELLALAERFGNRKIDRVSDGDLARVRRLMGMILYRDREMQLRGCADDSVIQEIGEAARRVAGYMSRAKLYDLDSIREALSWGREAQLMGGRGDDGVIENALRWTVERFKVLESELRTLMAVTDPTDADKGRALVLYHEVKQVGSLREAWGGNPEANRALMAEFESWCGRTGARCPVEKR